MVDGETSTGRRGRPTIDDVARAAGVSRQTVSNVIRGHGRLSADTRDKVERAIDELGYAPHPGASSLRSGRTRQLAHLLPPGELDPANVIALEFIRELVAAAAAHDYYVLVGSATGGEAEVRAVIRSGRVDAFIFTALRPDDPRVRVAVDTGFPFACFGRTAPTAPQAWVDVDNAAGAGEAVRYAVAKGHRRIAFLGTGSDDYWERDRVRGYRAAIQNAGLESQVWTCPTSGASAGEDLAVVSDALRAGQPTAVIASGDAITTAVYRSAQRRGLTIGTDIDVIGFEGGLVGRSLTPPLTAVSMPVATIAERVVDRVLHELEAGPTGLPGELVALSLDRRDSA
jgi:DNA-binding LacI/PurR family transcriptional regulator